MDDLFNSVNPILMTDENQSNSNISSNIHQKLDFYKKKANFITNQTERRNLILTEQKKKREIKFDSKRSIHLNKFSLENTKSVNKKTFLNQEYANQLMYSEWLVEVPIDFQINWIMVLCPVGKRCLVVASEGITNVFNKVGKLINKHTSKLPGGSKETKVDYTILDCIYNEKLMTYFVLDCLCWKSHPIMDSEVFFNASKLNYKFFMLKLSMKTEFRFYWLNCKLEESSEISIKSYGNPYAFKNLPRIENLSKENIQQIFDRKFDFNIDGCLFYHKEAHYVPGYTPLVGWLKPFMIPEVLNVQMPDSILKTAPSDYTDFKNSIEKFEIDEINKYSNLN